MCLDTVVGGREVYASVCVWIQFLGVVVGGVCMHIPLTLVDSNRGCVCIYASIQVCVCEDTCIQVYRFMYVFVYVCTIYIYGVHSCLWYVCVCARPPISP